jgi:plasmid stability protein
MGQILIRNVDDSVLEALRRRAADTGLSLEEAARRALTSAAGLSRDEAISRLNAIRSRIGEVEGSSVLEDVRADRRRDE